MAGILDQIGEEQAKIRDKKDHQKALNLKRYICFNLNDREYGISIDYVQEIIDIEYIRNIIYTPSFVSGLINLRGSIVAVMDLKNFFGFGQINIKAKDSKLLILNFEDKSLGFSVDKIVKIREICPDDVQPSPPTFNEIPENYIIGMYKTQQKNLLVLLNVVEILNSNEFVELTGEDDSN